MIDNISTPLTCVCLPGEINGRDSGWAGIRANGWAPEQPTHAVPIIYCNAGPDASRRFRPASCDPWRQSSFDHELWPGRFGRSRRTQPASPHACSTTSWAACWLFAYVWLTDQPKHQLMVCLHTNIQAMVKLRHQVYTETTSRDSSMQSNSC